jgi:hypothetical protein
MTFEVEILDNTRGREVDSFSPDVWTSVMPRQFRVTSIFVTTGRAIGVTSDGQPYVIEEAPEGSILAVDVNGDIFRYVGPDGQLNGPGADHASPSFDPWAKACFPEPTKRFLKKGVITLYRDYWRFLCGSDPKSMFDRAIRLTPQRKIR